MITIADPCDAASGNADSDSDGLTDICDLDNDNDGIVDTEEGCGNTSDITGTVGVSGAGCCLVTDGDNYALVGTNVTYNISTTSGNGQAYGYTAGANGPSIRLEEGTSAPWVGEFNTTFSSPVEQLRFKMTDYDQGEDLIYNIYDENDSIYDLTTTGVVSYGNQYCPEW